MENARTGTELLQKTTICGIVSPVMKMKSSVKGTLALVIGTVIWGSTFIAQSVGMDLIEPFTFQAIRCGLGGLFLLPVIFLFDKAKDKNANYFHLWCNRQLWLSGIICGIALYAASGLQQMGLVYTPAGKAGFITSMYIVLVPILGLFLRRRPPVMAWVSVGIATVGLYLLSSSGDSGISRGDALLMASALSFAIQITLIDLLAGELDSLRLNCIQALVTAALSAVTMALTEQPVWSNITACALPLCYAGILSMGVAYSLQIIGQKHLPPTPASLIMSLESVFALLCGWLLLHETLTTREAGGCVLVFSAVILSQLPVKGRK